jgi:hypothetical protein
MVVSLAETSFCRALIGKKEGWNAKRKNNERNGSDFFFTRIQVEMKICCQAFVLAGIIEAGIHPSG